MEFQRKLADYSPRGHKELDMTEWLTPGMHGQAECMIHQGSVINLWLDLRLESESFWNSILTQPHPVDL